MTRFWKCTDIHNLWSSFCWMATCIACYSSLKSMCNPAVIFFHSRFLVQYFFAFNCVCFFVYSICDLLLFHDLPFWCWTLALKVLVILHNLFSPWLGTDFLHYYSQFVKLHAVLFGNCGHFELLSPCFSSVKSCLQIRERTIRIDCSRCVDTLSLSL